MKEIWKVIPGYNGDYEVSNTGKVKSLKGDEPIILKTRKATWGHEFVSLCKDGICKNNYVHRLVAQCFLGEAPKGKPHVLHKDDNKSNNMLTNLYWGDDIDNTRDRKRNGIHQCEGEKCGTSKLKRAQVLEIRRRYKNETCAELAKEYRVCNQTICNVANKNTWKHI